jgi:hypothetical protein
MRAYGQERLAEAGLDADLRHQHAAYYLDLVRSARSTLLGPGQATVLRAFEVELGNIRAALAWFVEQDQAAQALRLAGWLYPLWDRHGHYREGREWLVRALALDTPEAGTARSRALDSAAGLALILGDHETAATEAALAAAMSRQAGDRAGLAQALTTRGLAAVYAGDIDRAIELLTEARGVAVAVGDRHAEGSSMLYLMTAHLARGEPDRTWQLGGECELLLDRLGDPEGLAWTRVLRGAAAWRRGDLEEANRVLRPGVVGFAELGHVVGLSVGIFVRAQLAAGTNWDDAVVLLAASEALRESVGAALLPFARPWLDELMGHAVAAIGDAAVERLWRAGASYPPSAAVDRALNA